MEPLYADVAGTDYKVLGAATYQAVCYAIWPIGYQQSSYEGRPTANKQVIFAWEINERMETDDKYNGKRYVQSEFFNLSIGKKSNLRKALESWRGQPFASDEEAKAFDINSMLNQNCLLNIIHNKNGKAKVSNISPLMKGMVPLVPEINSNPPAWVKKKIAEQITLEVAQEIWAEAQSMKEAEPSSIPF